MNTAKPHDLDLQDKSHRQCRILSLDGGGSKGFYTLGVLKELERKYGRPLSENFELIFGTSTGAIIATLISLGYEVDEIKALYEKYVPAVMGKLTKRNRTKALQQLAQKVFEKKSFKDVKTRVGIVSAKWIQETPMIFKSHADQNHGEIQKFIPGFGVSLADAVQASCAAYPFFERVVIKKIDGQQIELVDGGYCANNPTLYAISEAVEALDVDIKSIRVLSVGVGSYRLPAKMHMWLIRKIPFNSIDLLEKTLQMNTQSMDQLRKVLFRDVPMIRISDDFSSEEFSVDMLESDIKKLDHLYQLGKDSFNSRQEDIKQFFA
jgi:patatin-like phospholipase/acyl hydrolase